VSNITSTVIDSKIQAKNFRVDALMEYINITPPYMYGIAAK
jgi:hypothetical protein